MNGARGPRSADLYSSLPSGIHYDLSSDVSVSGLKGVYRLPDCSCGWVRDKPTYTEHLLLVVAGIHFYVTN